MNDELFNIYEYFSHNFRTFTSTIVAGIEVLKLDFDVDKKSGVASIYESSYLLDLYDNAFNICLKHVLGKNDNLSKSNFKPLNTVEKLLDEFDDLIKLKQITVSIENMAENGVAGYEFVYKNLFQIIIYEIVRVSQGDIDIRFWDSEIQVCYEEITENLPDIFSIFKEILKKYDMLFFYENNRVILEFL
jgi:hypothetical protein